MDGMKWKGKERLMDGMDEQMHEHFKILRVIVRVFLVKLCVIIISFLYYLQ